MADFWKSQPRKYCEACKCWFADNKSSIDFHEKGKNHQANVQRRIREVSKKGQKMWKAQQKHENIMDKINEAALYAYSKDVESSGSAVGKMQLLEEASKLKERRAQKFEEQAQRESINIKTWFEAMTTEGQTYYWNSETGTSSWEVPASGYIPLSEQHPTAVPEESTKPEDTEETFGPQPRGNPYGEWRTVETKAPRKVDLQLPSKPEVEEVTITVPKDEPKARFTEKKVDSLSLPSDGETTFKKRKFIGSGKRNVRQRTDSD
ncbi:WW domain-binding protein 4-like [Ornithodoros turicata]|uniref:Putative spliceosomal protein fbp21 n=1 Tax=Ornithodoros turicata TaxID=34597 RepID=A0A2R5LJT4_9ACAR